MHQVIGIVVDFRHTRSPALLPFLEMLLRPFIIISHYKIYYTIYIFITYSSLLYIMKSPSKICPSSLYTTTCKMFLAPFLSISANDKSPQMGDIHCIATCPNMLVMQLHPGLLLLHHPVSLFRYSRHIRPDAQSRKIGKSSLIISN